MKRILRLISMTVTLAAAFATGACEMGSSIQQVKAQHEAELMAIPGVVSVGIGKNGKGEPVIVVGVEQEGEETLSAIPRSLSGYPVEVRPIGRIVTH